MNVLIISDIPTASKERIADCFPSDWKLRFASPGKEKPLLASAEVIIPEHITIDEEFLKRCPRLQMIQTGAGHDNINLSACRNKSIIVCHAAGINAVAVAEHTMAMILSWYKRIAPASRQEGSELCGLSIGIAGLGRIGQKVAKYCEAFDMKVLRYSHHPGEGDTDWETLLRESDILTLHVPLTPETRYIIGRPELELMKKTALLVNTSRGAVVNESALIEALQCGRIAGACLDVSEQEPLPQDSPLRDLKNVLLTHHTAGYPDGPKFHRKRYLFFAENIQKLADGQEPINRIL